MPQNKITTGNSLLDFACIIALTFHITYSIHLANTGEILTAISAFLAFLLIGTFGLLVLILAIVKVAIMNEWNFFTNKILFTSTDIIACTILTIGLYYYFKHRAYLTQSAASKAIQAE